MSSKTHHKLKHFLPTILEFRNYHQNFSLMFLVVGSSSSVRLLPRSQQHQTIAFDPCGRSLSPPSLTSPSFPVSMPSVGLINHIPSFHPLLPATRCSISHCSTHTSSRSHPVVVMVNSISHTPLTHPRRARPLPSEC